MYFAPFDKTVWESYLDEDDEDSLVLSMGVSDYDISCF
jgi:hypothetical protein